MQQNLKQAYCMQAAGLSVEGFEAGCDCSEGVSPPVLM